MQVLKTERFSLETTYTIQALFPDIKAILSNSRVVGAISGYKLAIQEINWKLVAEITDIRSNKIQINDLRE